MAKLNYIHVTPRKHYSYTAWGDFDKNGVTIISEKEQWTIHIDATDGGSNLGAVKIKVQLAKNSWDGTIQDFKAIRNYAENAYKLISQYGMGDGEELKELQALLAHFGQKVELPAPSPERSKELALISCIMTHNFFDVMMQDSRMQGMINCYDLIAGWAAEFYEKYRFHTNWEEVPAEFPGCTGWEDSICMFTANKIASLR